ncbi:hypothetical protein A5893_08930 [Pedobacter psychrophilus]|uniref:Plasmid stabilization protein n=1 Tax=Pedobacter psychrophilus TaxID=1826909 RepID=A0A179DF72_9SPHI|nr:hypothetical protein [Pedobacter psychrophilus]OAQ39697.1 hypothetical protein A5893_08930 [Pedobacter psychrophilus]
MADKKSVVWSSRANLEYTNLIDYLLNNWGLILTKEVISKINDSIDRITTSSEQFPIVSQTKPIRKCVISKQTSIFFISSLEKIFIISLFDNRQNPDKIFT